MLLAFDASDFLSPVSEGHIWNKDTIRGGSAGFLPQLLLFSYISLKSVEVDGEKSDERIDSLDATKETQY